MGPPRCFAPRATRRTARPSSANRPQRTAIPASPVAANHGSLALPMAIAAASASARAGRMKVRQRSGSPLPTSPRSSRAGRVSPALATIRQLAAKLINTPNSAAWAKAVHCGAGVWCNWEQRFGDLADQRRGHGSGRQADDDGHARDQADLRQQHGIDRRTACPDQFQDGDGRAARCGESGGCARHAEPADRQRRQSHEQQHLAQPIDEAASAASGFIAAGRAPSGFGEALLKCLARGFGVGGGRQDDAIAGAAKAARLDQPAHRQPGLVHQRRRREREAGGARQFFDHRRHAVSWRGRSVRCRRY